MKLSVNDGIIYQAIMRGLISADLNTGSVFRHIAGRIRKINPSTDTRNFCRFSLCLDGTIKSVSVHRVVWIFANGLPTDNRLQINHIDGNRLNNKLSNLEMVTSSRNQRHAAEIGLRETGLKSLTSDQILAIKTRYKYRSMFDGINAMQKDYGVSKTAIWRAIYGCDVTKRFKGQEHQESTGHRRDMRYCRKNDLSAEFLEERK
jgi:hypothetical protein